MSKISDYLDDLRKQKRDLSKKIDLLKSLELLDFSEKQFHELNKELKNLSTSSRRKKIQQIILGAIPIKFYMAGLRTSEVKIICRHIEKNWNMIIEHNANIGFSELINKSLECFDRKEKKILEDIEKKQLNKVKIKKRVIGVTRLLVSGGVVAIDTKLLLADLENVNLSRINNGIFTASYFLALTIFFDGVDHLFNL